MAEQQGCLSEHQEQCLFVEWFELQFPKIRIMAIPNGLRAGGIGAAVKAKKEGLRKGVPDLFVPAWKLWIEFKREKGGRLSPEQKDWIEYLESCGYSTFVAKGCGDGQVKLAQFLDSL